MSASSNLPPGTTNADIDRAFGEPHLCPRCQSETPNDGLCDDCWIDLGEPELDGP